MDFSLINDRIGWFSQVKSHINSIYIRLERMINGLLLNNTSLISHDMVIWPDAIICFNCIIWEIKKSFWAHMGAKENITHIFKIILFVLFFSSIYLGVGEIESEVQLVLIYFKELLNLLWRGARTRRIGVIFAGWDSNCIVRIILWGVLALEIHCCVHRGTKPPTCSEFLKSIYNVWVISKILFCTGFKGNVVDFINDSVCWVVNLKNNI